MKTDANFHDANGGELESSSESADSAGTSWIGRFALGLRRTFVGYDDKSGYNADEAGSSVTSNKESINERGRKKEIITAALTLDKESHSKMSQFGNSSTVDMAQSIEKDTTVENQKDTVHIVAQEQPSSRRHRIIQRQPTGDETAFGVLCSAPPVKREGAHVVPSTTAKSFGTTNTNENHNISTLPNEPSGEDCKQSRCKPLLERKPTGDEDDWDNVVPASPRRGRRKSSQDDDQNREKGSAQLNQRPRPIVKRQATGDGETFATVEQHQPRAPRRGRKIASNQSNAVGEEQGSPPTRRINKTTTGDLSGDNSVSSDQNSTPSCDEHSSQGKRRSRPLVSRQNTGDEADFGVLAASVPRRDRCGRDVSESSQSQSVDDSTGGSQISRRSRPVIRRQPTGDACDFNVVTSASHRPKRRSRVVDDQSNSQSSSDNIHDPSGIESDHRPINSSTTQEDCQIGAEERVPVYRSRPVVRRQQTGDMASSSGPSSPRKGRRRNRDSSGSPSSTSSSCMITRTGLTRQVTGDGMTLMQPPNPHVPMVIKGPDVAVVTAWIAETSPLIVESKDGPVAVHVEENPVAVNVNVSLAEESRVSIPSQGCRNEDATTKSPSCTLSSHVAVRADVTNNVHEDGSLTVCAPILVKSAESEQDFELVGNIQRSSDTDQNVSVAEEAVRSLNGTRRGVRRQPTGDLDSLFLNEFPLSFINDLPKPPQRWTGHSPTSPPHLSSRATKETGRAGDKSRGVLRTPTGDDAEFAVLMDIGPDNESSGNIPNTAPANTRRESDSGLERPLAMDGSVAVQKTRGVQRTPTGDEAEFAMLLDIDGEETSKRDSMSSGTMLEEGSATVEKTRGVRRTPTGDEAEFTMLLNVVSDEDSSGSIVESNRYVDLTPSSDSAEKRTCPGSVPHGSSTRAAEKTDDVKISPVGEFATLLDIESDDESSECIVDASFADIIPSPTRGVKRTPTGDGGDFAMYFQDELVDDDESSDFSGQLADAHERARDSPTRRPVQRAQTGDETAFALMMDPESRDHGT